LEQTTSKAPNQPQKKKPVADHAIAACSAEHANQKKLLNQKTSSSKQQTMQ
jgi:hypothetical protein